MTATTIGTTARTVGIVAVLVAAAILGLIVGNAMQGRSDTTFGYPTGYQGGAAAPRPNVVVVDHLQNYLADRRGDVEHVDYLQEYLAARAGAAEAGTPTSPTPR